MPRFPRGVVTGKNSFTRTLKDLDDLSSSEWIQRQRFENFSLADLKKMKSDDLRCLYKKKIEQFVDTFVKTVEKAPNEKVSRYEQSEIKNLTSILTNFRDQCEKDGLAVKEFEEESVKFITDEYTRFFFKSKWAQRLYNLNNGIASTSLGYWGYRAVGSLGSTNRFLLQTELSKSFLPIAYFTGVTCRFWAYITSPYPPVSKVFDGISNVAMSPIWLLESLFNKVTGPIFKRTPLKTPIPLNITGEVAAGSGLTWDKLNHTYNFVKDMTANWPK